MTLFDDDPTARIHAEANSAVISSCRRYRYRLGRHWSLELPHALFVMLNPSIADASINDPTITRCMGFARRWQLGGIEVVNLLAYRTAYPTDLTTALKAGIDIVGPENDDAIRDALCDPMVDRVVCAWGANAIARSRVDRLVEIAAEQEHRLLCLGTTKSGAPTHPLYLADDTPLVEWSLDDLSAP